MTSIQNYFDAPNPPPLIVVLDVILSSICELCTIASQGSDLFRTSSILLSHSIEEEGILRSRGPGVSYYPCQVVFLVSLTFFLPQWTSRLIIILWQSAVPPTLCMFGVFLVYIASRHLHPVQSLLWPGG
jgi:hypothetical protein